MLFKFDDSLVHHILRLVLSMERKKKQATNTIFSTIKDEKEELKEMVPALAMPNTENTLIDELEGLKTKWEKERVENEVNWIKIYKISL